ncbi:MAG: amidophosphoribosyltransferase [Leptotrichia sp.]|nr:amidophosphoribosyltransferase [Leptotrichia sp.]
MEEECGVIAFHSNKIRENLTSLAYIGMQALQHRGQECAGMTICDSITENKVRHKTLKDMGLVSEVFSMEELLKYKGNILIGHVRYATTGIVNVDNAQPFSGDSGMGNISLAHNGNLIKIEKLKEKLMKDGITFHATSDTEVILKLLGRNAKYGMKEALLKTLDVIEGAFALVIIINDKLIGIRDPRGIRPLCMGQREDGTYVLASETVALDTVNAKYIRDIDAGEMIIIDENGIESIKYLELLENNRKNEGKASCAFEYVYFARPDSIIDGIDVYQVRHDAGRYLHEQHPVEADIVIGVPDSGIPAAIGYAEASGIPFAKALVKNKYIGRSFIYPTQELREQAVKVKLNPIRKMIEGKRVVVVDDSLVRGTTSKKLIKMIRDAGAKEVHFRAASPIVIKEDFFGVNVNPEAHLIGNYLTLDEIRDKIGATTLGYLSYENLRKIFGRDDFYMDCFKKDDK